MKFLNLLLPFKVCLVWIYDKTFYRIFISICLQDIYQSQNTWQRRMSMFNGELLSVIRLRKLCDKTFYLSKQSSNRQRMKEDCSSAFTEPWKGKGKAKVWGSITKNTFAFIGFSFRSWIFDYISVQWEYLAMLCGRLAASHTKSEVERKENSSKHFSRLWISMKNFRFTFSTLKYEALCLCSCWIMSKDFLCLFPWN